jgi:hypothetical protein
MVLHLVKCCMVKKAKTEGSIVVSMILALQLDIVSGVA